MSRELREDGGFELREDGGFELREGPDDESSIAELLRGGVFSPVLPRRRRRDIRVVGSDLRIVARLFPGGAVGTAAVAGASIRNAAPRIARIEGQVIRLSRRLAAGEARGQIAFDRDVVDADLLAFAAGGF